MRKGSQVSERSRLVRHDPERGAENPRQNRYARLAKAFLVLLGVLVSFGGSGILLLVYLAHSMPEFAAIISIPLAICAGILSAIVYYEGKPARVIDAPKVPAPDDDEDVRMNTAENSPEHSSHSSDSDLVIIADVTKEKGKKAILLANMLAAFDEVTGATYDGSGMGSLLEAAQGVADLLKTQFIYAFYDYYSKKDPASKEILEAKVDELQREKISNENIIKIMAAGFKALSGKTTAESCARTLFGELNIIPVSTTTVTVTALNVATTADAPLIKVPPVTSSSSATSAVKSINDDAKSSAGASATKSTVATSTGHLRDKGTPVFMPGADDPTAIFAAVGNLKSAAAPK
jgi:hypothetical protein